MICLRLCRIAVTETAPEHAHDAVALDQREIERNLGDGAVGKPDDEPTTIPAYRAGQGFCKITTHRIKNDVSACATG